MLRLAVRRAAGVAGAARRAPALHARMASTLLDTLIENGDLDDATKRAVFAPANISDVTSAARKVEARAATAANNGEDVSSDALPDIKVTGSEPPMKLHGIGGQYAMALYEETFERESLFRAFSEATQLLQRIESDPTALSVVTNAAGQDMVTWAGSLNLVLGGDQPVDADDEAVTMSEDGEEGDEEYRAAVEALLDGEEAGVWVRTSEDVTLDGVPTATAVAEATAATDAEAAELKKAATATDKATEVEVLPDDDAQAGKDEVEYDEEEYDGEMTVEDEYLSVTDGEEADASAADVAAAAAPGDENEEYEIGYYEVEDYDDEAAAGAGGDADERFGASAADRKEYNFDSSSLLITRVRSQVQDLEAARAAVVAAAGDVDSADMPSKVAAAVGGDDDVARGLEAFRATLREEGAWPITPEAVADALFAMEDGSEESDAGGADADVAAAAAAGEEPSEMEYRDYYTDAELSQTPEELADAAMVHTDDSAELVAAELGDDVDDASQLLSAQPRLAPTLLAMHTRSDLQHAPAMLSGFRSLVKELLGVREVTVRAAVPLDDTMLDALRERVRPLADGKDVSLTYSHDDSVTTGFVVEMDDGDEFEFGGTADRMAELEERLRRVSI